jgi:radical SAM protein with 4Fe4S-binding SPASM domain
MIFKETHSAFLPCGKKLIEPSKIKNINFASMIKREESNGTIVFVNPKTREIYFKKEDTNIFPLDLPIHVDIELTQKCNLKCKHCFITERKYSFSKKTFEVIKKLSEEGVIIFELIGGEPFLVKEIFPIIKYLKNNRKIVTIATNGTLITDNIAKNLAKNPPHKIFVSLDGPKKINDFIRGKGSFDKTTTGIYNLNKVGIIPSISYCINRLNLNAINVFVKEIEDLNLKIKNIFFIFGERPPQKKNFDNFFFTHNERGVVAKKISKMKIPARYVMHFAPRRKNALYYGCFFRLTMCEVTPVGDILSCPILRKKEGNILKEDLKTIWKRMWHNLLKEKSRKCTECVWKKRCFPCKFDKV